MLEDLGCDVVTAADAEEALETLADQRVEILITDVNMPGMGWIRTGQRGRENA
jgi:CheY-like chemotaxis protein